jgi:hypothetical protein
MARLGWLGPMVAWLISRALEAMIQTIEAAGTARRRLVGTYGR